jgi:DNA-binding GntR family transcriptional regulator
MVRLATQKMRLADIRKLEKNVSACEERLKKSKKHFTKREFFDLDRENVNFHRLIAEGTHNPVLSLTIEYVFDFLTLCEKDLLMPDFHYSRETVEEHKRILSSLKRRDGEEAENAMAHHLRALDKYLRDIQKKPLNARISWVLKRGLGKGK